MTVLAQFGTSQQLNGQVNPADSSGNGAPSLSIPAGVLASVPSPAGPGFGQAAEFSTGGGQVPQAGAGGATAEWGAVTGTAFTFDAIFTPSANDLGNNVTPPIIGGVAHPQEQWVVFLNINLLNAEWVDSAGTYHNLQISQSLVAGTTYAVRLRWDGSNVYLYVVDQAGSIYSTSLAITSVRAPASNGYFIFQDNAYSSGTGLTIDELRVQASDMGALTAFPTVPLTSGYAGFLYHLDGATSAQPNYAAQISSNATITVQSPPNNPQADFIALVLYNYSPYRLLATVGSNQSWIEAASAVCFPLPPNGSPIAVTPVNYPPTPSNSGSGLAVFLTPPQQATVQGVFYTAQDGMPQGFPQPLNNVEYSYNGIITGVASSNAFFPILEVGGNGVVVNNIAVSPSYGTGGYIQFYANIKNYLGNYVGNYIYTGTFTWPSGSVPTATPPFSGALYVPAGSVIEGLGGVESSSAINFSLWFQQL